MELNKTNTAINDLKQKYVDDLKSYLKERGHEGKGVLSDSIQVNVIKDLDGWNLQLTSKEYIKYLEHGDFLKNFQIKFINEIKKILSDAAKEDLIKEFKNKIKQ